MSAITESQTGDKIIIIQGFHASPNNQPFSWQTSREFKVGESVLFQSFFHDRALQDHPGLGWMIVFDTSDGKQYAADQAFFVTTDCWSKLRDHFTKPQRSQRRKAAHR
jgi:hypothetical protein